nr:immunoglobulin heavy chain junction region [Macaca mulatta]
CARKEDDLDLC